MTYLLSTSPGFYTEAGVLVRISAGTTIAVEDSEVSGLLNQHSGFVVLRADAGPIFNIEESFAVSTTQAQGEVPAVEEEKLEAIRPIPPISFVDLPPGASATEALVYLQDLSKLTPVPLAVVKEVGLLYPTNKKVSSLVAQILASSKVTDIEETLAT